MKLNETALEAAAQVEWENWGYQGRFREDSANPDYWTVHTSRIVLAYLDALDAEGLADLYECWSERIEALPVEELQAGELQEGDTFAHRAGDGWMISKAKTNHSYMGRFRVLRRARRQWKVGDLVDNTRDLPAGAIVRYDNGVLGEFDAEAEKFRFHDAVRATLSHSKFNNPRIIWLPENGDES